MPTLDHQDWIADEIEEGPILVLDGSHSQIVLLKHLLGLKQPGLQGGHGAQVSTNGDPSYRVHGLALANGYNPLQEVRFEDGTVWNLAALSAMTLGGTEGNDTLTVQNILKDHTIYGVGGLAISQLLWIIAVGSLGIAMSALHINLTPFYVMIFMLALGGSWSWLQAAGAALVAVGVLIAQGMIKLPGR